MEVKENLFEYYGFSEQEINLTMGSFFPENFNANNFFLKEGDIAGKIGFVKSGFFRSFIYDDNANEITTQFFQPGMLIISFDSFNNQIPAKENIVAITDSELFVVTYSKLHELYQMVPAWNQICKDIADLKSNELISRSVQFQTLSATERYLQFCQQYPEIVKNVALKHIASFLGIDVATLSRIRKKK
jgi:CRP/FNR family transcriptional regulator, anaerobic regulatory protein